ncbi:MAG TPA: T9SS type A sorting domain-containing protein [Ferruginibacter sp.]|nr:T9SS type A sorting domain-containing protein [Ferruginibacter sp.]
MKKLLLSGFFGLILGHGFSQTKTWIGASGANWNVAGNWSPSGVPAATDTVFINSFNACNVDINPTIASLRATGTGGTFISTAAVRTITINNNGATSPVLYVATGASLSFGNGGFGISITTHSASGNYAQIDGIMGFGFASTWNLCNAGFSSTTNADIAGTLQFVSIHTGTAIANGSVANLRFLNGSTLYWSKSGGNLPVADYQNGSTINLVGTTTVMPVLSASANYNGLLIWNSNLGQTISGASAVLFPGSAFSIDSLRVISTGTGTLRLFTEPAGYTIGHLEVQGGTLELSAPIIANRSGSISTDFKISGGTVYCNATYAGDGATAYAMTLTVNGNLTVSGGTLNLTNRVSGATPGGACQLNVKGNVTQTAGSITATTAYGSQNQLVLNGTVSQNLQMSNFTGPAALVMNNAAGAVLQAPLTLSYVLNLLSGILTSSSVNLLTMSAGSLVFSASNNSFVNGPVRKTGNTAFTFPVGKPNCGPSGAVNGYAALSISNFTGGAVTDQFTAEYKRGDAMTLGAISNAGLHHISRCDYWTLTRDNGASTADITLAWDENINDCNATLPYVNNLPTLTIAHNNNAGGTWDAIGVAGITTGTAAAGTVIWNGTQSATFGAFAIGSTNFQNPLPVVINYFNGVKQNNLHILNWKLTCYSTPQVNMVLERSSDGNNYIPIHQLSATALQCRQPFSYTDADPVKGLNHYRLKITDAGGKISYSPLVNLLHADRGFDVQQIAPNPVTGTSFKLKLSAAQATAMEILVTDLQGRVQQQQPVNAIAGSNEILVDVRNLPAGTYQVFGRGNDGRTAVLRFVKQ